MKKYLLIPVVLLALIYFIPNANASPSMDALNGCIEKQGWDSSMFNSPENHVGDRNPVEYYEEYISILQCYLATFGRGDNGPGFLLIVVNNFSRRQLGFDPMKDCRSPTNDKVCNPRSFECNQGCSQLGGDPYRECFANCVNNVWYPCMVETEIGCENQLVSKIRTYAASLPMPDEPKEPECGPSEYNVGGVCKHIFELCGRDSLFTYNESTGNCSCPDMYIVMDGKCVHEDDLAPPPPRDDYYTPPTDLSVDEPPPDELLPPQDQPPPDDPLIDDGNAFCQPSNVVTSYNEYGIPVANAQIYSSYSVVEDIKGEVLVKTKGATQWSPAFKGMRLNIGDRIKTGETGKCTVRFANSAQMKMRKFSEIYVPEPDDPRICDIGMRVGYLDVKFRKLWNKINSKGGLYIRTPTAIAGGGSDSRRPMYNLNKNNGDKIVHNILKIPLVSAEDDETILHVSYDEETEISKFYVEKGSVDIMDLNEITSVPLSAGEQIVVESDIMPHDTNIEPVFQVKEQWWEEWDDDSGASGFVIISILIAGVAAIVFLVRKCKKRNILLRVGIVIVGILLTSMLIVFVQ